MEQKSLDQRSSIEKEIDRFVLQRVLRGMDLLKEKYGEHWVEHINLSTLNLRSGASCVLGQVYGEFSRGCDRLGITAYASDASDPKDAAYYGFNSTDSGRSEDDDFDQLQAAWEAELEQLLMGEPDVVRS